MSPRTVGLFDKYSAELTALRPEFHETFLCPLCLRTFGRPALALRGQDGLTLEHIIPGTLGGRQTTLTCGRCNNSHGSVLEGHLTRMIDARNWEDGDGSVLKGTIEMAGIELPMKIAWGAGIDPNVISIPGANAEALADFKDLMNRVPPSPEFQIKWNYNYIPCRVQRALVRIGYLSLFETLGYEYVLSGAAKYIRDLIAGEHTDQLWQFTPQIRVMEDKGRKGSIIHWRVGSLAHLLIVCIKALKRTCYYAVLMPSNSVAEESVLNSLAQALSLLQRN